MKVVASNSASDLARKDAESRVRHTIRGLAANIVRVVRGAGKPTDLGSEAQDFVQALVNYYEAFGHYPPAEELRGHLSIDRESPFVEEHQEERFFQHGIDVVVRGALQMAASELVDQTTQRASGENQLFDGMRMIEDAREAMRRVREHGSKRSSPKKK